MMTASFFGLYPMDFARDRPTPFDWVVDDLAYGPGAPQSVVPVPPAACQPQPLPDVIASRRHSHDTLNKEGATR